MPAHMQDMMRRSSVAGVMMAGCVQVITRRNAGKCSSKWTGQGTKDSDWTGVTLYQNRPNCRVEG